VDVHFRDGILHGAENIAIVKFRQVARQSTLDTNFSRTELPGLDSFLRHLLHRKEVRVRLARAAAECAKLASYETDICEIDIAIHDIGDDVADNIRAQKIRSDQKAQQVVSLAFASA
jgi:hypothetical protein